MNKLFIIPILLVALFLTFGCTGDKVIMINDTNLADVNVWIGELDTNFETAGYDFGDYVPYTGATDTVDLGSEMLTTDGQVQAESFFGDELILWDLENVADGVITLLSKSLTNSVGISAGDAVSDIHGSKLFHFRSGQNKFLFLKSDYGNYFGIDTNGSVPVLSSYLGDVNMDGNWHVNGNVNIQGNLTVDGNTSSNYVFVNKVYHAYGGFQDQTETLSIDADTWTFVTNADNNLWTGFEADGMMLVDDNMVISNAGDYVGNLSVTFEGGIQKDYLFRIYNMTQDEQAGYYIGASGLGNNNYTNVSIPIYLEVNAGDVYQFQVYEANGTDAMFLNAIFILNYLHD